GVLQYLNTNKRAVTLDLETQTGRQLFHRLLEKANILVSDHAPADLERLGLLYEKAKDHNRALIACAVTPFGLTGPYRDKRADDVVAVSLGGMAAAAAGRRRRRDPPMR